MHTCLIVDDSHPTPPDFAVGWDEVARVVAGEETTPLEATLEAAGEVLLRLEPRDNWLLWIDLATPLPPWDVPEEFRRRTSRRNQSRTKRAEDEEEAEENEPLMPMTEPAAGPIESRRRSLFFERADQLRGGRHLSRRGRGPVARSAVKIYKGARKCCSSSRPMSDRTSVNTASSGRWRLAAR